MRIPTTVARECSKASSRSRRAARSAPMAFSSLAFLLLVDRTFANIDFALELEECIRAQARRMAETFPTWGNSCMPPTS